MVFLTTISIFLNYFLSQKISVCSFFQIKNINIFPRIILSMGKLFKEETAAGDFGAVYLILVFAIVAVALVAVVKPMYKSAQKTIPKTTN